MKKLICPKCGKQLMSLDAAGIDFWCCGLNIEILPGPDITISSDELKVNLFNGDEGRCGDYNPEDPEDINLLRFDIYKRDKEYDSNDPYLEYWENVEDASYCTCLSADDPIEDLVKAAYLIFKEYQNADLDCSVKKLGEALSWISIEDVRENTSLDWNTSLDVPERPQIVATITKWGDNDFSLEMLDCDAEKTAQVQALLQDDCGSSERGPGEYLIPSVRGLLVKSVLYAEWIESMKSYRLFSPEKPNSTIAYESNLEDAKAKGYHILYEVCDVNRRV